MTFSTLASPGVSLQGGGGSGGGGTPGGSDTQIQYNSSGTFAGASGLTTNGTELTIASGTKTADAPVLNMSQTWNNGAVTFTGLKFNATYTASAAASLLMDLQVGGTSQFRVRKDGEVIPGGSILKVSNNIALTGTNANLYNRSGNLTLGDTSDNYAVSISGAANAGITLKSAGVLRWTDGTSFSGTSDLFLARRAAANLRLGAADAAAPVAQTLSVQSVVAGITNTAGTNLTITGSQGTGTGAGGSIIFQVAPAGSSGTAQNALATALTIDSAKSATLEGTQLNIVGGNLILGSTAMRLIGFASSAFIDSGNSMFHFRNYASGTEAVLVVDDANKLALRNGNNGQTFRLYGRFTDITNDFERFFIEAPTTSGAAVLLGTQKGATTGAARALELQTDGTTRLTISTTGNATVTGWLQTNLYFVAPAAALGGNGGVYFGSASSNGSQIQSTGAGILAFGNFAGSDFNRLQFGGTSASFPALKRSSASLIVRLADDTANAALESASLKTDAPTGGTAATWKLGVRVAATTLLDTTQYIEVDVGGTLYKLAVVTT